MRKLCCLLLAVILPACCDASIEQQLRAELRLKRIALPEAVFLVHDAKSTGNKQLVLGAANRRGKEVWVRVRCRQSTDCKPVFARLQYSTTEAAESVARQLSGGGSRNQEPILIRAGSHVRLSIHFRRVVLSVEAVALQNGRKGEVIRAKSDGNIHYATVASSTELKELL